MPRCVALPGLDAAAYRPDDLHAETQVWLEKNCYVDIWIEVLHALGLEPRAAMAFALAVDFEGDQWSPGAPTVWQKLEREPSTQANGVYKIGFRYVDWLITACSAKLL